jgi:hypothetical protein
VQRVAIDIAMHGDRADAHFLTRPDNPAGNLAAIRDQDLLEFSNLRRHV